MEDLGWNGLGLYPTKMMNVMEVDGDVMRARLSAGTISRRDYYAPRRARAKFQKVFKKFQKNVFRKNLFFKKKYFFEK